MLCVQTSRLSYRYGATPVLDAIALEVPDGSIYGFLGPNGAGKTTTLRLLLGLLRRQAGAISIFGRDLARDRIDILRKVGSLIETPSVYDHLTAAENLAIWHQVHGGPARRIADVLAQVGLGDAGRKKTGQFSLGMKQRLGIAIALLHDPALLILDEPTNGLDPAGIVEIRALLKTLNREHGTTILVSSHLLSEIEKLASDVGIIHGGRMLFQGPLRELRARHLQATSIRMRTSDDVRAQQWLCGRAVDAHCQDDAIVLPPLPHAHVAEINRALVLDGIDVHEISVVRNDLESLFLSMVETRA